MLSDDLAKAASGFAPVQEASLGRIYQHHKTRAFAILTAWRGERTLEENQVAFQKLKQRIRGSGYGFIPLDGVGQEKVGGKVVEASEPSLLVPNKVKGPDDGTFRKIALGWALEASKPPQYAIFFATPDGEGGTDGAVLKVGGGVEMKLSKFSPSMVGQFYSKLRRGRTFMYAPSAEESVEWLGVKYGDPPQGWIHGMGMQSEGRLEIARYSETLDEWRQEFAEYLD